MPGPPPDRNPRRANYRGEWRRLPAAGRAGEPPTFPLPRPAKSVLTLWADLWRTPQAIAWEELGWTRVVARYTKLAIASERKDAKVTLLAEVRQLEDRLGLNPKAMKSLMWEIAPDVAEEDQPADVANLDEYRSRLG